MLRYIIKFFDELTLVELYRILQLRSEIFVVEQNCPYLDADDKDQLAYHVMGLDDKGTIQACTRLLNKGISYPSYSSIGRVVNSHKVRKTGEGKRLMQFSIDKIREIYPEDDIKISAQSYLLQFYKDLGFEPTGEEYLEDDIPHTGMVHKIS